MRHSFAKFILVLVLVKIDQLDSKAVEVIYTGQGCECEKSLPFQVNIPVAPEPSGVELRSYGYKIEKPAHARAKYSYSFDFLVEEPIPPTPKPISREHLFATVDRIAIPKPDCVMEKGSAPCGIPFSAPELAPPQPAFKPCRFDKTRPCTCGLCPSAKVPIDYTFEHNAPLISRSCACGKCCPSNPQCRYVLSDVQTNHIARLGGRSKRDLLSKKPDYLRDIRNYVKSLKTLKSTRVTRKIKKSKLVKRDIKGEYDLLQKDQAALDLTIPEIIQYMPETLMPNFKRGKCNIGCRNCINKSQQQIEKESAADTDTSNSQQAQQLEEPQKDSNDNAQQQTLPNVQFHSMPRFNEASYLKRSVNPYQYQYPCYPALLPPPYVPNPLHMATLAQNPGNPIWYQPRPLIDPNGHYVYDRLGHKYEVKNGSLKLVTSPQNADEVNVSAPPASVDVVLADQNNEENSATTTETATATLATAQQAQSEVKAAMNGEQQLLQAPIVGAPGYQGPSNDPQMDKVIRDIIYRHPDFIEASKHAPGSLTQPQEVQSTETMQFLDKLIRGRLNNWFGYNDEAQPQNLQDLHRYARETGASIRFIPVVTVNEGKLKQYRRLKAKSAA